MKEEGKYNINAVSKLLNIKPVTLRAWERRYDIVKPVRNHAGYRLYTDEHLKILKWLIHKLNEGMTIGQAVQLLEQQGIEEVKKADDRMKNQLDNLSTQLLEALRRFDDSAANELLDQAFAMFSLQTLRKELFVPFLKKVGDVWEAGEISCAQERFISSYVRFKLGAIYYSLKPDERFPKVVAVCSPSERHELGLLMFTFYLRQQGFDVIYLGEGVPKEELIDVINKVNAQLLFLSCTMDEHVSETLDIIHEFSRREQRVRIGIGGRAIERMEQHLRAIYRDVIIGCDEQSWNEWTEKVLMDEFGIKSEKSEK
ncbi:MerR family transcriptional regulator [Texcoconibacillus texcoconensis]|uniref:DNA-binding transcriptional MerR regulator/methylmalonyl-CoA mutase cobalamin-binding subunit n=1 Tax=Texcoconibacillus texcoconensis TaxID=1095777 RepID=A0A840QNF9_9BACI|nr:cobalamin-dependent protein [Texcoconibacillus texcoconensis]MBB5172922.1 DNA-binding transcriptional MerR regulator/methylmalonyl-CoA mutase cobalamin-binding subunit [Texcoconibacillus texcoconensis]